MLIVSHSCFKILHKFMCPHTLAMNGFPTSSKMLCVEILSVLARMLRCFFSLANVWIARKLPTIPIDLSLGRPSVLSSLHEMYCPKLHQKMFIQTHNTILQASIKAMQKLITVSKPTSDQKLRSKGNL